jgi:mRNA interferase MazF
MEITQGDVVWVDLPPPRGSEPAGRRPALVLQTNRYNRSRVSTVVVVAITTSLRLAGAPGNVRLRQGEAGLPRPSVVNVSQIATIDRAFVGDRAGRLSRGRLHEVWTGVLLVLQPED